MVGCGPAEKAGPLRGGTSIRIPLAGHEVHGRIYPPAETGPETPGLVLYAASNAGKAAFEVLAQSAQREGYGAIILDASHGLDQMALEGEALARHAAESLSRAVQVLEEAGVSRSHLAIVGAGRAGALALYFAAANEEVAAVVLLSALLETRGVEAKPAMERFGRRPVLLMAGRGDPLAMGALEALRPLAQGMCEVRIYGAAARGADLLNLSVRVEEQILLWLRPILGEALQTSHLP